MILIDSRAGSCELVKPLTEMGLPVEETTLEYGDLAFMGRGEKETPVFIGVEHKKLPDLVQSLGTGRLQDTQLRGMLASYDRMWLLIEGDWQHDAKGRVSMFKGRGERRPLRGAPPAIELEKQILNLSLRGGFHVRHCPTRRDSVRFLCALYRYWTDKALDEHKSHLAIHNPDLDRKGLAIPISDFRRIAAAIPGIGYSTSSAVERHFEGSFRRMMQAPLDEWSEITTYDDHGKERRIGTSRAKKIMEALT